MTGFVNRMLNRLSQSKTNDLASSPKGRDPGNDKDAWHLIKLGILGGKQHFEWNAYSCGNALVFGLPGSGKSSVQHTVIQHCLAYSEQWQVMAIDLSGEELVFYMTSDIPLENVATTVEASVVLLRRVKKIMLERYAAMAETNSRLEMTEDVKRIMVVIDEASDLITPAPDTDGPEEIRLKEEAHRLIHELAGQSRAAGINLMVGGINPWPSMSGELRNNFFPVISLGDYDSASDYSPTGSWNSPPELLASGTARGSGCITTLLGPAEFQAYSFS